MSNIQGHQGEGNNGNLQKKVTEPSFEETPKDKKVKDFEPMQATDINDLD